MTGNTGELRVVSGKVCQKPLFRPAPAGFAATGLLSLHNPMSPGPGPGQRGLEPCRECDSIVEGIPGLLLFMECGKLYNTVAL